MQPRRAVRLLIPVLLAAPFAVASSAGAQALAGPAPATQTDASYAASFAANHVTNVDATGSAVSCYRPEVPYDVSDGPAGRDNRQFPLPGATPGRGNRGPRPHPT